ncbi:Activator of Hsp90 ATPase homolog 1-like protein [Chryseolinea serpens]|uniref:Activator of Hsp90 ATPase homolog 1-like protein n=1 Tax=Chryseolinea serpens TaxID=947013 RepID=A0A1M5MAB0_9BACT|nr:SRPBCC domain-containing protein [Chryseolinea serpens]SHG73623.1 Activator of Hsp90 ATPase homolog 1-like protein [Chryseolinea serpens]
MKDQSYTATIAIAHSPKDVFDRLKKVSTWWSGEGFEGRSANPGDEFTIRHGDVHYSKQKLVDVIPDRKIVWLVTESRLTWLERDQHEWTNTKMIFEIVTKGDMTELTFTHEGLVPEKECYSKCIQGWDVVIKVAFAKAMVTGDGRG